MKVVILAGGLGTRISEETVSRPKPMIEIGGRPILWHIMKIYSFYGMNDFIICCGYKGYMIKEYFANYFLHMSDVTIDIKNNQMSLHKGSAEPWRVTLVDTGEDTMTGGRLKRIKEYVKEEKAFCFTYGDGVSNVNITKLVDFHFNYRKKVTLTAVYPPGRFGAIDIGVDKLVTSFREKPKGDGGKVNGGFFVVNPTVLDLIEDDSISWEAKPLEDLALMNEVVAYEHNDFWQPMDTLRDKIYLETLWKERRAPWNLWS